MKFCTGKLFQVKTIVKDDGSVEQDLNHVTIAVEEKFEDMPKSRAEIILIEMSRAISDWCIGIFAALLVLLLGMTSAEMDVKDLIAYIGAPEHFVSIITMPLMVVFVGLVFYRAIPLGTESMLLRLGGYALGVILGYILFRIEAERIFQFSLDSLWFILTFICTKIIIGLVLIVFNLIRRMRFNGLKAKLEDNQ